MNAGKTLASAVALVTFGRRRIVGSIKALLAWRQLLAVAWRPPVVRRIAPLETILCLLALMSVPVWGASTGSGSGYGLAVNATVFLGPVVNVGPLANTGTQAAPPDFNTTQTAVSAIVVAGILTVNTGALSAQTQSLLAQNSVQSAAQVDNLTVNALTLALGASTVRSTAAVTCAAGFPATAGTTTIVGGTGLLWYTREPFGNVVIRVVYRNPGGANSGVFIRIPERPTEPRMPINRGYEVQIDDRADEYHMTGVLYALTRAAVSPGRPDEWNTMEITLDQDRTVVVLNGVQVTDYREGDPVPSKEETRGGDRGPRPLIGYIGLQNHDPRSTVFFKEISILR